jgi:hypothetical protein
MYFNDTYATPDDGGEVGTKYVRKPQLLNMAVNSWLKTVIGELLMALCTLSACTAVAVQTEPANWLVHHTLAWARSILSVTSLPSIPVCV